MHKESAVLFSTLLYLVIDLLYISYSSNFYNNAVYRIQGRPMPGLNKPFGYIIGSATYIILVFGWAYFIGMNTHSYTSFWKQLESSIIFALTVYGVFNGTVYLMFDNYGIDVLIRDTLWGVSVVSIISMLHLFIVKYVLYQ